MCVAMQVHLALHVDQTLLEGTRSWEESDELWLYVDWACVLGCDSCLFGSGTVYDFSLALVCGAMSVFTILSYGLCRHMNISSLYCPLPLPVPDVAPTGVTLQPINSTAIRLSWQPLEEASVPGVLTQYTVVYNHKGGEERHQKMVNVTARSEE